ncbi:hypothetical protein D1872_257900 [compost metagenome]
MLGNGLGYIHVEAFNVSSGCILEAEELGIVLHTDNELAALLDSFQCSSLSTAFGTIIAGATAVTSPTTSKNKE